MNLVYYTIESYKKRTCKTSAAIALDSQILLRDYGLGVLLGESHRALYGAPALRGSGPQGVQTWL